MSVCQEETFITSSGSSPGAHFASTPPESQAAARVVSHALQEAKIREETGTSSVTRSSSVPEPLLNAVPFAYRNPFAKQRPETPPGEGWRRYRPFSLPPRRVIAWTS